MKINNWTKFILSEATTQANVYTLVKINKQPYVTAPNDIQQDIEDYFLSILDQFDLKFKFFLDSFEENNKWVDLLSVSWRYIGDRVPKIMKPRYFVSISGELTDSVLKEEQLERCMDKLRKSKRYDLDSFLIKMNRQITEKSSVQKIQIEIYIVDSWLAQIDPEEIKLREELDSLGYQLTEYSNLLSFRYQKNVNFYTGFERKRNPDGRFTKSESPKEGTDIKQSVFKFLLEEHTKLSALIKDLTPIEVTKIHNHNQRWRSLDEFEKYCTDTDNTLQGRAIRNFEFLARSPSYLVRFTFTENFVTIVISSC